MTNNYNRDPTRAYVPVQLINTMTGITHTPKKNLYIEIYMCVCGHSYVTYGHIYANSRLLIFIKCAIHHKNYILISPDAQ